MYLYIYFVKNIYYNRIILYILYYNSWFFFKNCIFNIIYKYYIFLEFDKLYILIFNIPIIFLLMIIVFF